MTRMRHHRLGLLLSLALAFLLAGCALLGSAIKVAGPFACTALVDVLAPGSGTTVLARLCPEAAAALGELIAEGGDGGRLVRGPHGGPCDPVQVHDVDPAAPTGAAYYCGGRLGGNVRDWHAAVLKRAEERRVRADGGVK